MQTKMPHQLQPLQVDEQLGENQYFSDVQLDYWLESVGISRGKKKKNYECVCTAQRIYTGRGEMLPADEFQPMLLKVSKRGSDKGGCPVREYHVLEKLCRPRSVFVEDYRKHVCVPTAMVLMDENTLYSVMAEGSADLFSLVAANAEDSSDRINEVEIKEDCSSVLTADHSEDVVHQMLKGLAFLHSQKIIHVDIKLENVVCFADDSTQYGWRFVIIDFGLCLDAENQNAMPENAGGTCKYAAPELLRVCEGNKACVYGYHNDLWSVGVIYYMLLQIPQPHFPWEYASTKFQKYRAYVAAYNDDIPLHNLPKKDNSLLYALLHPNYRKRVSAEDAIAKLENKL